MQLARLRRKYQSRWDDTHPIFEHVHLRNIHTDTYTETHGIFVTIRKQLPGGDDDMAKRQKMAQDSRYNASWRLDLWQNGCQHKLYS